LKTDPLDLDSLLTHKIIGDNMEDKQKKEIEEN
jgi:hypothetical protein